MESFIRHSYAFKIMVNYKHLTLKYFLPYSTYLMLVFLLLNKVIIIIIVGGSKDDLWVSILAV